MNRNEYFIRVDIKVFFFFYFYEVSLPHLCQAERIGKHQHFMNAQTESKLSQVYVVKITAIPIQFPQINIDFLFRFSVLLPPFFQASYRSSFIFK